MSNYVATSSVVIYNTVEEATAGLETAIEAVVNTGVIRTSSVIRISGEKYAAVLVWTTAV